MVTISFPDIINLNLNKVGSRRLDSSGDRINLMIQRYKDAKFF